MIKSLKKLGIALFILLVAQLGFAQISSAQVAESISDYQVDISINPDSSILVSEKITYDFGVMAKHGIFRDIPYKYKARGGTFKLRLSNVLVTDDKGNEIHVSQSYSGNNLNLKIGDSEKTVTGVNVYEISYQINRAINYFSDHDELYWNAIGSDWEVPIAKSSVVIHSPAVISQMACYTGVDGSKEQNCSIAGGNTETVTYTSTKPLGNGEGLTIVAGLPAGSLAKPTMVQKIGDIILDNGILILPLLVLLLMLYLWNRFGKDAISKNSVVAQYEAPEKMSALYVGTLAHDKTENKDIAAELVYLASRGFLTIKRVETTRLLVFKGVDYEFTKIEKDPNILQPQTKALLNAIFFGNSTSSKLSDLKSDTSFGQSLLKIRTETLSELVKNGYFKANPSLVKGLWFTAGIIIAVFGSFLFGSIIGYLGVIATILSGVIIIVFSFIMPARTQKGADTVALVAGLKDYLTVAEKDRLKFHNAPEKNPQHFEALLPFAIALGVEAAWAAQFKDLTNAPSWYNDGTGGAFNALLFTSAMSDFSSSVQSVASSTTSASSGGSGFSGGGGGGGFGGGGGGSW